MKAVVKKKRSQKRRSAFSLVELLVVMTIVAALVAIAIPAINAMQKSFGSTGAEGMISAALATARTLAIKNGHYTGVRFQKVYDPAGALKADQYMIFIIYDSNKKTNWVCGFVAVEGYKPIKLPENIGVIDKIIWRARGPGADCGSATVEDSLLNTDLDDGNPANLDPDGSNKNITDISTFSIVFSPAGKLVSQVMRCGAKGAGDDVFNTIANIIGVSPAGMFAVDDEEAYGIGVEMSRREFVLYDREKFEKMTTSTQRWDYLKDLKDNHTMYINPYTGEIIK